MLAHPVCGEGEGLEAPQAVAVEGAAAQFVLEGQAAGVRIAFVVLDQVEAVVRHVHVKTVGRDP